MKQGLLTLAMTLLASVIYSQTTYTFNYTGASQSLAVSAGSYSIECWGGNGGTTAGGKGGYSTGSITITSPTTLYIYVGGAGNISNTTGSGNALGGWNGGGNGSCNASYGTSGGGGGGSDVRTTQNTTYANRIIVAGGGGGGSVPGSYGYSGGNGGGTTGGTGTAYGSYWIGQGGTQTAGGAGTTESNSTVGSGSLGLGGNHSSTAASSGWTGCGGGGGYYGGSAGGAVHSGGGGGSGYVGGVSGGLTARLGQTGFVANPVTTGPGLVRIKELCNISLVATGTDTNNAICSGSTVTLTTNAVSNYTWNTGANTSSIIITPTATTVYSLTATSASACNASAQVTITVYPGAPTLSVVNTASASNGICPNSTVALTASGAVSYTWAGATPVTNGVVFSPTVTSGYTVTGLNTCGTATAATSISIHPFPTVGAVASTPSLCSGLSATVTATGNAASYTWSPVGITNGAGFFPSFTNTYIVVGTSALSCTASAATVITVVTTPSLAPTANPALICIGNSSTLTATGATNYTWLPGSSNTASTVVSPTAAINTFTIIRSNSNCVTTQTLNVIVNQLPTVFAIATPTLVCAGKPSTLAVGGAQTYTWTAPGPPTYTFTGASPVVSPQSNTTYTVAAHDGTCVNTTTVAVATDPNPTLSIAATNTNICAGQSVTLTASGGINYTWTANSTNSATGTSYSDTPSGPTLFSLIGDNSFGCTSTISQIVLVNPNPTITIATSKTLVCSGGPSTITASGANTYVWDANAGGATTAGTIVNPINTMVYTVTGTYASTGCNSTKTVEVKVFTPTITVTNPTNTCYGGNITLVASGANPGTYNWNTGSGFTNPFQTIAVTPTVFTIYTVSAISGSNGVNCPSTQTTSIGIFYNPTITAVPERTFFCRGEQLNIVGNGGVSYVWSNSQTGGTITVSPNTNTNYTVTGTDANGCVSTGTLQVKVSGCVGINELGAAGAGLSIYPNPNNGEFRVSSETALELSLMNELGQVVRTISLNAANNYKADISELAQGIYFVSGKVNGSMVNQKIIVSNK